MIQCLFLLFFYDNESFDLYADRGFEKIIYRNMNFQAFELRGINGEAFKLRVDIKSSEESFTENWPMNVPDLSWQKQNTIPSPRSFHQIMTKRNILKRLPTSYIIIKL